MRLDDVLEELKGAYTDKKSYTLKYEDWLAIRRKAYLLGREPRMVITIHPPGKEPIELVVTEE